MASEDLKIIVSLYDLLTTPLLELQSKMSNFGSKSKSEVEGVGKAFEKLKTTMEPVLEALAAMGIAFGGIEIGKSFLEAATDAEVLKARLDTFTKGQGNEAFEALSQEAIKLGISIKDATNGFITMQSDGVKPTESNFKTLVGTTEALKGSFDIGTFQSIANAIGMIGESSKSANSAFRMLGRMGIDVYDILEQKLHMTSTQIDNLAKSSVGAEQVQKELLDALTEKYGSTADKIAMTWNNMWQSIKDEFELFEEAVMNSGAFQYLEGELRNLLQYLQTVEGQHAMEIWAQRIGAAFIIAGNVIALFVNTLRAAYNEIMVIINGIGALFWGLVSIITQVVHIITSSLATITNAASRVMNAIAPDSGMTKAVDAVNAWTHSANNAVNATTQWANANHALQADALKDHLLGTAEAGKSLITNLQDISKAMAMLTAEPTGKSSEHTSEWPTNLETHLHGTAAPATGKTARPKSENLQKEIDQYIKLLELMSQEEEAQAKLDLDTGEINQVQYEQKLIEIRNTEIQTLKEAASLQENNGTKYIELKTKIINLEDQNVQTLKEINKLQQEQQINLLNTQMAVTKLGEAEGKISNVEAIKQEISLNQQSIDKYKDKLATMKTTDQEYANTVKQITSLINANKQLQQALLVQTGTFDQGVKQGFQDYLKNAQTAFQMGQTLAQNAAQSMSQAFGTSFFDIVTGKLNNLRQVWSQFFASIAQQIAQMIAQLMIMNALKSLGGMLGFANGGVVNGLQIGAFAGGGIVGSPTLALIGEGAHREAIVPLPDGKSIPVSMQGGDSGGGVNIVNVLDSNVFNKWANTLSGKKTIRNIIGKQNKSALDWS